MTKDELCKLLTWRNSDEANFACLLPLFGQTLKVEIFTQTPRTISDRSLSIVNDLLQLTPRHLAVIKGFLWEDCKFCCETIGWGVDVPEGKTEAEANHMDLGVFNEEDAFRKSTPSLSVYESNELKYAANYGLLCFDNSWNSSLTTVVMRNGEIVGCGDNGLYLGEFETPVGS